MFIQKQKDVFFLTLEDVNRGDVFLYMIIMFTLYTSYSSLQQHHFSVDYINPELVAALGDSWDSMKEHEICLDSAWYHLTTFQKTTPQQKLVASFEMEKQRIHSFSLSLRDFNTNADVETAAQIYTKDVKQFRTLLRYVLF